MGTAAQVWEMCGEVWKWAEAKGVFPIFLSSPNTALRRSPPRLLESVPRPGQERTAISLGFQCVQLLISDFLPTLPKEHIPKTLDVVALFAQQVRWNGG